MNRNHATNIIIDVQLGHSFTYLHYLEQLYSHELEIFYRYHKDFTALYRDKYGNEEMRTYSMFVRYLDLEEVPPREEELKKRLLDSGTMSCFNLNEIEFKKIDMAASVPALIEHIKTGPYYGKKYSLKS